MQDTLSGDLRKNSMPVAKLFLGPQDGLVLKVAAVLSAITISRYGEVINGVSTINKDRYVYDDSACTADCPYLHYRYVETQTQTKEQND